MKRYILAVMLAVLVAALFVPAAASGEVFDMRQNPGPTAVTDRYVGLSSDTKPTTGNWIGDTFRETDTQRRFAWDGTAWNAIDLLATASPDTLASPGTSNVIAVAGKTYIAYLYNVSSINTSVTCQMEAKKGTSGWTTLGSAMTHTANGDYGLFSQQIAPYDSVRFNFAAEVGGTAAQVIVIPSTGREDNR